MIIETIHYERRVSDGAGGNRSLSMSARLDAGDNASVALAVLAKLVRGALAYEDAEERQRLQNEQQRLQEQREHAVTAQRGHGAEGAGQ